MSLCNKIASPLPMLVVGVLACGAGVAGATTANRPLALLTPMHRDIVTR